MRLLSITLENFLAYHVKTTVPLQDVTLAVLSGDNGAGKSSLLDAVTWALWGQARAKTDDELLYTGQSAMTVTVEFQHDGSRYQVSRIHELKHTNKLLFYRAEADGQWLPLSDGKPKITQPILDKLLKLNYNTFVNSAYLQQGKADSLMLQPPRERKDLLVNILDLTRWARYEKAAKTQRDALDREGQSLADKIAERDQELDAEPRLRDDWQAAQRAYIEAEQRYGEIAEQQRQLQSVADALRAAEERQAMLQHQIKRTRDRAADDDQQLLAARQDVELWQPLIDSAAEIEAGYAELQALNAERERWDEGRAQFLELDGALKTAHKVLESDIDSTRKQIASLQRKLPADTLAVQLDSLNAEIDALEQAAAEQTTVRAQITAFEREKSALSADNEAITKQAELLKERLAVLESSADAAQCPVCRQPLDAVHKAEVIREFEIERDGLRAEYKQKNMRLKQIEKDKQHDEQQDRNLAERLRSRADLLKRQASISAALTTGEQTQRELSEAYERLNNLQQRLDQQDFGHETRQQLRDLGYDAAAHDQYRLRRKSLEVYVAHHVQLETARAQLPGVQTTIAIIEARQAEDSRQLGDDQTSLEACRDEIGALHEKNRERERIEAAYKQARQVRDDARFNQQSAEQKLNALPQIRQQRDELNARRDQLLEARDDYQQIVDACSRNGVVLLIIDSALEMLNDATNQLLSRLTNNQLHVNFSTQSVTKGGDLIDTLDIVINDGEMSRAYELYSGGEGFRINFAVRVALSQMLARRAGTQLQTLVIDEGFGSQDSAGREKLIDAINVIRSQFDLILVVTHIDELRDAFPMQIRVAKGPEGSMVHVSNYDYDAG